MIVRRVSTPYISQQTQGTMDSATVGIQEEFVIDALIILASGT